MVRKRLQKEDNDGEEEIDGEKQNNKKKNKKQSKEFVCLLL